MKNSKKSFYTRPKFFIIIFTSLALIILLLIPMGLTQRSIGGQLLDTAEQFTELYVYDEKEHWTDEEWNEYWSDHPDYMADTAGLDWESYTDGHTPDDPRLDEMPPGYSQLWNIDFSNLETTQQYDLTLDELALDEEGGPIAEDFIYREKTTGNQIIDVTLDGFILSLNADYRAGWKTRSDSDPNGFNKFKKALNLNLAKNIKEKLCYVEIAPYDWSGPYQDEKLNHDLYDLTMRYSPELHTPEKPNRFLRVILQEAPYNTDTYSIEINPSSPKECFDANLELEILKGMRFLPPELKRQGIDYDELNKFPTPYYWPKPLNEAIKISKDETLNKQIIEYDGFRLQVDPKWQVTYDEERGLKITASRRCDVFVNNWGAWEQDFEEKGVENLNDYLHIIHKKILKPEWGVESRGGQIERISDQPYEIYKVENTTDLGDGVQTTYGGYTIKDKEKIISIGWSFENPFEDVPRGSCNEFGQAVFEALEF